MNCNQGRGCSLVPPPFVIAGTGSIKTSERPSCHISLCVNSCVFSLLHMYAVHVVAYMYFLFHSFARHKCTVQFTYIPERTKMLENFLAPLLLILPSACDDHYNFMTKFPRENFYRSIGNEIYKSVVHSITGELKAIIVVDR